MSLEGSNSEHDYFGPDPALSSARAALSGLLSEVLKAYVPALQETSPYSPDWHCQDKAAIKLLKRYRLYTREVEKLVHHVWPDFEVEA